MTPRWRRRVSIYLLLLLFFFSSRRRHTRCSRDWSSDVCSSDLNASLEASSPRYLSFFPVPHRTFLERPGPAFPGQHFPNAACFRHVLFGGVPREQIGRASCRERV